MKMEYLIACFSLVVLLTGCKKGNEPLVNRNNDFNNSWLFLPDSISGGENPLLDDSRWQPVDLPHDWSGGFINDTAHRSYTDDSLHIGRFSKKSAGGTSTGYTQGGTGWYRKHFSLNRSGRNKTAVVLFDGAYMESEVWVNGKNAGKNLYGYNPFWFDITPLLNKPGKDNLIAVRVSNTGKNSRWYSGSGIYRNVTLLLLEPVHAAVWGIHITTPVVRSDSARIEIAVKAENKTDRGQKARVSVVIEDPEGNRAGSSTSFLSLHPGSSGVSRHLVTVPTPLLWSPDSPRLYRAVVSISAKNTRTDQVIQPFGIRTISVSAENGLLLNGDPIELRGACVHHDNGLLGAAAITRAEERKVEILKANGFNAVRTSHNPPSAAFLDACDRLGMLVIDEAFDMWERPKNTNDYHRYFRTSWKENLEAMILRDRNHPSVFCWSIGNEVNERADTSGIRIAKNLIGLIRQLDNRPLTNAICEFWDHPGTRWEATAPAFALLDIGGYNYQYQKYEPDHALFPKRVMMGTESVPMAALENWEQVEKNSYVIGDFVWTGIDYLGETGIGHTRYLPEKEPEVFSLGWPWFNAWCGDLDITGQKKPQMLYRDVVWGNSLIELTAKPAVPKGLTEKTSYWGWPPEQPSWNWAGFEDSLMTVHVYTRGDSVRLDLNGRTIALQAAEKKRGITFAFQVPYEPGELTAQVWQNGSNLALKTLRSTGVAAAIELTADRNPIRADRNDLVYIDIDIIDEFGQLVNDASLPVTLMLEGPGEFAGTGSAAPFDMHSYGRTRIKTYRGRGQAIIRPLESTGKITLTATSPHINPAVQQVEVVSSSANAWP